MNKKNRNIDMTKGSIGKGLLLFAIPLLLSSLIQQMYNTVDLLFIGNILGKESAAAVGASSMIITCLIGLFSGLAVGANVVVARIVGSKDNEKLRDAIHTAITMALIGGIILTIMGLMSSYYLLKLMNIPKEIIGEATNYIKIYFISITPMIMYNMASGIVRAGGNSRMPMIAQFIGGLINILANTVFVYLLDFGVQGAAWATFFSQTTAAVLVLAYLVREKGKFHLNYKELKINKIMISQIAVIGIPAGIQAMIISLSNAVAQSHINSLDVNSIAAFTAYYKVELLLYYPIVAMGQAVMTFVGQNIGARKVKRVEKGIALSIFGGILVVILGSTLLQLKGEFFFKIFNNDSQVISKGIEIISITFPFYFFYVILEVLSAAIRGAGKTISSMIIVIANVCILRITLLYLIVPNIHNVKGVALVYPITWITTSICMSIYFVFYIKRGEI